MTVLDQALAGITKLGIDTSPFIYFIESHPIYLRLMRDIIQRIDTGTIRGYSSVLTLMEVLVHPKQLNQPIIAKKYHDLLQNSRHFELIPIDINIAEQAAELRSRYHLRSPDALQLATIDSRGCQAFLTNDKALKKVKKLPIIVLNDLLEKV